MLEDNPYEFLGGATEETISSTVGIVVYVERNENKIDDESLIAVGKARELADMLGTGIGAIMLNTNNENIAHQVFHAGADRIFLSSDNRFMNYDTELYCGQIVELIKIHQPEIFLSAHTPTTIDFIPRTAQRLQTGLVSGCISLEIDTTERLLLVTRPAYGSKMYEIYMCQTARPQIVILKPSTFPPPLMDDLRQGLIEKI